MSRKYRPLTRREVVAGLQALGFSPRDTKAGGSHQQWIKDVTRNGRPFRHKVTVDEHHAPYHRDLLKSMINQAGVTRDEFYLACGVAV